MHQTSALVQSSKLEPALELEPEQHELEPERGSERVWVPEPELELEPVWLLALPASRHPTPIASIVVAKPAAAHGFVIPRTPTWGHHASEQAMCWASSRVTSSAGFRNT